MCCVCSVICVYVWCVYVVWVVEYLLCVYRVVCISMCAVICVSMCDVYGCGIVWCV